MFSLINGNKMIPDKALRYSQISKWVLRLNVNKYRAQGGYSVREERTAEQRNTNTCLRGTRNSSNWSR